MLCFESFLGVTEVRKCIWSSKGCSLVLRSVRCVAWSGDCTTGTRHKAQLCGERGVDRSFQNRKLGLVFALQVVITFSF